MSKVDLGNGQSVDTKDLADADLQVLSRWFESGSTDQERDQTILQGLSDDALSKILGQEIPTSAAREGYAEGKDAPEWFKWSAAIAQGPLLQFADELVGGTMAGIAKGVGADPKYTYEKTRGAVRRAAKDVETEYPFTSTAAQIVPSIFVNPMRAASQIPGLGKALTKVSKVPVLGRVGSGLAYGGAYGAGLADNSDDIMSKALSEGAKGAIFTPVMSGGMQILGKGARGMAAAPGINRMINAPGIGSAVDKLMGLGKNSLAAGRIGQAIQRDDTTPERMAARLDKLGPEATLADAAGQNTRNLLDTIATMPGKTGNQVESVIRNRQATRDQRLRGAAEDNMNTSGGRLSDRVASWLNARQREASPLYERAHAMTVDITGMGKMLKAINELGGMETARKMATADLRELGINLADKTASVRDLDYIKQGLDQLIARETKPDGITPLGTRYIALQKQFVAAVDAKTTDRTGASVYRMARAQFEGPSAMIDAAQKGSNMMTSTADQIRAATRGMTQSELEAYRVGAAEALRVKLGSQAGQTQMQGMWRDANMRERLQAAFGSPREYRQFAARVAAEERMKRLEQVGRGSQTARRLEGMDDVETSNAQDVVNAAAAVAGRAGPGGIARLVDKGLNAARRSYTPEPLRDEIGATLLKKGPEAQEQLRQISEFLKRFDAQRQKREAAAGALTRVGASDEMGSYLLDLLYKQR